MLGVTRRRVSVLTTQSAVEVMAVLNQMGGRAQLGDLSRKVAMTSSNISPVITRLALAGLITLSKSGRRSMVTIDHEGCIDVMNGLAAILIPKGTHVTLPIEGEHDLAAAELLLGRGTRPAGVAGRVEPEGGGETVVEDEPPEGHKPVRKRAPWSEEDAGPELPELGDLEGW